MAFKKACLLGFSTFFLYAHSLEAHCQMPCGIYHDDMIYDMVDQYVETMYKAITEINDNKFQTSKDKNQLIRWILLKENSSNEMAELLTTYFLQQKTKPGEENTVKVLESAHRLLFLLMQIKQTVDVKILMQFSDEWDKFKLMFHVEGYECQMEKMKMGMRQKAIENAEKEHSDQINEKDEHDHPHP